MYNWKGKMENSSEIVTILKTKKENWNVVKKEIEAIHPYECPCIIKLDVEANSAFEDWLGKECI